MWPKTSSKIIFLTAARIRYKWPNGSLARDLGVVVVSPSPCLVSASCLILAQPRTWLRSTGNVALHSGSTAGVTLYPWGVYPVPLRTPLRSATLPRSGCRLAFRLGSRHCCATLPYWGRRFTSLPHRGCHFASRFNRGHRPAPFPHRGPRSRSPPCWGCFRL